MDYCRRYKERHGVWPNDKYRAPVKSAAPCMGCGKRITRTTRPDPRCRACTALAKRAAARRRAAVAQLEQAAQGVLANSQWPWVQGTCTWCDQPFTRRGAASPYCSKVCRQKDRKSGTWITRRERLAIYERDGWTCQLCLEPVDALLHYSDDWAASLDHIEPRSLALFPDHSPANLRLAHRWCNSVRGDGRYYSEADLRAA